MNEFELRNLIDHVSNNFENEFSIKVLESGRRGLLDPALPHLDDVTRELSQGRITVRFLEGSVDVVLVNATREKEVKHSHSIDDQAIKRSIARYCPYLFWC